MKKKFKLYKNVGGSGGATYRVSLPVQFLRDLDMENDEAVNIEKVDGGILITKGEFNMMNIDGLLDTLRNKVSNKIARDLERNLEQENVEDVDYEDYKKCRAEEDRELNVEEFYRNQEWVLDRFFPVEYNGEIFDIDIKEYEIAEDTQIQIEFIEE